jgi:hypothetical protein
MLLKNYVSLSGTCQKVHVTASDHLNIVKYINSFFSGHEINQYAPFGISESHHFSSQWYGGGDGRCCSSSLEMQQDFIQCSILG